MPQRSLPRSAVLTIYMLFSSAAGTMETFVFPALWVGVLLASNGTISVSLAE